MQHKAVCVAFRRLERIMQHRVDPTKEREELGGERNSPQSQTGEFPTVWHKRELTGGKPHVFQPAAMFCQRRYLV